MKTIITTLFLLVAAQAWGQDLFFRTNCDSITSPVANSTLCNQITTADDREAGHLYRWDGSAWVDVSEPSSTPGLQTVFEVSKEITGANSLANAFRVGGVAAWCIYDDAALGPMLRPCTASNVRTVILTNFTWALYDEEGAANVIVADPDALGAGSGTVTMQTAYQFGASNLGIEFTESDSNPVCAAGNFNIFADLSENKLKKCVNGVVSDL